VLVLTMALLLNYAIGALIVATYLAWVPMLLGVRVIAVREDATPAWVVRGTAILIGICSAGVVVMLLSVAGVLGAGPETR
jgi:amino acid permease